MRPDWRHFAEDVLTSPALQRWIEPRHLRLETVRAIHEGARAKPHMRYAVLDNFFREEAVAQLYAQHQSLEFRRDDVGLPYDSDVVLADGSHCGADLFFDASWWEYLLTLAGGGGAAQRSLVKLRRHSPEAKGFWMHTDRPARLAALCYFNRGWQAKDGALLQLWAAQRLPEEPPPGGYRFLDHADARLDFLHDARSLRIEAALEEGLGWTDGVLIDALLPEFNRLVVCDFETDPCFHTVTPSNGRSRYGFLQWLY